MDVQIRNQGAAVNTGITQPAFSLWMSHGRTVSLSYAVQWIRRPPVPRAALWGSCSCVYRAEIRDVTALLCTWDGNAVLTLQSHISAKPRSILVRTWLEQQNTTLALRRKKLVVFFFTFPWENCFRGQKAFAYCLWGKEVEHLELAFVCCWRSPWCLSVEESLKLESNVGLRPSFITIFELLYRTT